MLLLLLLLLLPPRTHTRTRAPRKQAGLRGVHIRDLTASELPVVPAVASNGWNQGAGLELPPQRIPLLGEVRALLVLRAATRLERDLPCV